VPTDDEVPALSLRPLDKSLPKEINAGGKVCCEESDV
jgi:hypothetical protein